MHSFFCFSINHSSSELRQLLPVSHTSTVCVWAGNSRGTANLNAAVSPQFDMVSKLSPRKSLAVPRTLHSRDQTSEPTSDQVRMDRMDLGQCTYTAKGRPDTAHSCLLVLLIEVPRVRLQKKAYLLLPSRDGRALRFPSQHCPIQLQPHRLLPTITPH